MAVTMKDVARRAGVSVKTVSNYVNDYPFMKPATKQRIADAMGELGYRLNLSARRLRTQRTGQITLVLPELSLPYFAQLADAVIRAADEQGLTVLIEQTSHNAGREMEVLSGHRQNLTDGVIFSPLELGPGDVASFHVDYPLVLLGERVFGAPVDHVTMNNVEAARAATAHLISLGRRRIAVIGAHAGEIIGSSALRLKGYQVALEDAGIEFDPSLVREAGLWHRATGAVAMAALLDDNVHFDAVFALNDAMALGALSTLTAHGIGVPSDVALMGFDDIDDVRYAVPSVSSVAPGREQIATQAVACLIERIGGDAGDYRLIVPEALVVGRQSTGDVGAAGDEVIVRKVTGSVEAVQAV